MILPLVLAAVVAAPTPASVAALSASGDVPLDAITAALNDADPLVRSTAARVVTVKKIVQAVPALRERLAAETDVNAAREEVRALAITGDASDIDSAIASTRRLGNPFVEVVVRAAARRPDAIELLPKLAASGFVPDSAFMVQALWGNPTAAVPAGSRFLGAGDAVAWRALLKALRNSGLAMDPNVLAVSLEATSEPIRAESVWYLVHGYALEPSRMPKAVVDALREAKEEPSLRELYGRELLNRMNGAAPKSDPRYIEWLVSPEGDAMIGAESALFTYFTEDEFLTRKRHCDIASAECRVPATRKGTFPSRPVTQADFDLPATLPAGLAEAIVHGTNCTDGWLAVATATVDRSGRVQKFALSQQNMDRRCAAAVDELLRLSLPTPTSIVSPLSTSNILLVQAPRSTPCLDEPAVGEGDAGLLTMTPDIRAPVVTHRVQPNFPVSALRSMGGSGEVVVTVESVISRTGCVRSIHLLTQSQFPEINAAAVQAIAQWRFAPAESNGRPVDVKFNLTFGFRVNH